MPRRPVCLRGLREHTEQYTLSTGYHRTTIAAVVIGYTAQHDNGVFSRHEDEQYLA